MIFFLNLDGTMSKADEQRIFQGSSNANKISVISPFLPPTALQIAFTLPNKLTTIYYPMSFEKSYEPDEQQPNLKVGLWSYTLPLMITENEGTVGVSVNVNVAGADAVESNQTSYTSSFEVEYSVLPAPPLNPTTSDVETLVNLLNAYYAQNQYLIEYGRIGTMIHVGSLVQGGESGGVVQVSNAGLASESRENDLYINLSGNLYTCTASNPTAGTSSWSYKTNIRGPQGPVGAKGEQGVPGINNALLQNAQGTSTNDGMTQDAITRSCFARIYRNFAEISPSFNGYTDIITLCDAMIDNSILITSMELDDSLVYPTNDGVLTVIKYSVQRVVLNYTRKAYNAKICRTWCGSIAGAIGTENRWSGWTEIKEKKQCLVGTNLVTGYSWLKFASIGPFAQNDDYSGILAVQYTYNSQRRGFLGLNFRSMSNDSFGKAQWSATNTISWLAGNMSALFETGIRAVYNNEQHGIDLYARVVNQYGYYNIEVISESSRGDQVPLITLYNNNTPEEVEPTANMTSKNDSFVDLTTSQTIGGNKTFLGEVRTKHSAFVIQNDTDEYNVAPSTPVYYSLVPLDKNNNDMGYVQYRHIQSGKIQACLYARNPYDNNYTGILASVLTPDDRAIIPNLNKQIDLGVYDNMWRNSYAQKYYEDGTALEDKYTDNPFNRAWSSGTLGSVRLPAEGTYQIKGVIKSVQVSFIIEHNSLFESSPVFFSNIGIAGMFGFSIVGNGTITANTVTESGTGDSLSGVIYYRQLN